MDGPDKLGLTRAPVHAPGNWQGIERALHDSRNEVGHSRTRPGAHEKQKRPFSFIDFLQPFDSRAAALCKLQSGLRRRASGIECRTYRRTLTLDILVRLTC